MKISVCIHGAGLCHERHFGKADQPGDVAPPTGLYPPSSERSSKHKINSNLNFPLEPLTLQTPLSNILTSWAPSCWDETNRAGSAFQTISGGTGCSSVVQHLPRRHGPGFHPRCGQKQRNENKPGASLAFAPSCLSPWYPLATPSCSPCPSLCPLDSWGALFLIVRFGPDPL